MATILLGTVAIEPNRWAAVDPSWAPTVSVADVLDRVQAAGFDGLELWEGHAVRVAAAEVGAIIAHPLPVTVFNSYVGFDDADATARTDAADWVRRLGCCAVKYNVGDQADQADAYAARIAAWIEQLPDVRLLCECHEGISIAEDPAVAADLFDRAGPPERVQAIVHLGEDRDLTVRRFDHYGDRITHVHVNFLGQGAPPLSQITDQVQARADLLRSRGFDGTWTIEFTHSVGSDDDRLEPLLESAVADLAVLREVVG